MREYQKNLSGNGRLYFILSYAVAYLYYYHYYRNGGYNTVRYMSLAGYRARVGTSWTTISKYPEDGITVGLENEKVRYGFYMTISELRDE